jgi:hypothetical protein
MATEFARILTALQHNMTGMSAKKSRKYIIQHQQAIHILFDELDHTNTVATGNDIVQSSRKNHTEIFSTTLESLLLDLQKCFPGYFNHQLKLPHAMSKKAKADIEQKTIALINQNSHTQTAETLKEILYPIISDHKTVTYHQKSYIDFLLEELGTTLHQTANPHQTIKIIILTISLNFNHPKFYKFCTGYFSKEIERCEDLSAQYSLLLLIGKSIKQAHRVSGQKYEPELPNIGESTLLQNWNT